MRRGRQRPGGVTGAGRERGQHQACLQRREVGSKASLRSQLVQPTGHHFGSDKRPCRQDQDDRVRDVELLSEYRGREVDLVTDHQVGRPRVVQLEVPAKAPTRVLGGVVPSQDIVFVGLVWLQQRPPLQRSALEVASACGELPVDVEGQEPARFQRRQIARMTNKGHRVPGIPQNIG